MADDARIPATQPAQRDASPPGFAVWDNGMTRRISADPAGLYTLVAEVAAPQVDLILFHGGGWVDGAPDALAWAAPRLAEAGLRLILPGYRVMNRHNSSLEDAIDDALHSAARLRQLPSRAPVQVIGGASAGGFLALHALRHAAPGSFDGLLLMNPVTDTGAEGFRNRQVPPRGKPALSPLGFAGEILKLPALILHPRGDQVVPYHQSLRFLEAWKNPLAQFEHWPDPGGHGAFNLPRHHQDFTAHVKSLVSILPLTPV